MLTKNDKKIINEKLEEIQNLIPKTIEANLIARTYLYKKSKNYTKEKNNLLNRGFKLIKTETDYSLIAHFMNEQGEKETWEKQYGNGEF